MGNKSPHMQKNRDGAGAEKESPKEGKDGKDAGNASKDNREGRKNIQVDDHHITGTLTDVRLKYKIDPKELGHGHYGVVRKCQNRETGDFYAVKTIRKSKVRRLEILRREIDILRTMDHPNIIKLIDVYEDDRFLHLVTELCTGGELFERIINKTKSAEGHYSEQDASVVIRCLLSAIEYCHTVHNISHRDLKPENLLFAGK
eukprot:gene10481-21857_t